MSSILVLSISQPSILLIRVDISSIYCPMSNLNFPWTLLSEHDSIFWDFESFCRVRPLGGGVLKYELVRMFDRSVDHLPINKPDTTQICHPDVNNLFLETNHYFLPCKLGRIGTFWQLIGNHIKQAFTFCIWD